MRIPLEPVSSDGRVAHLRATIAPAAQPVRIRYRTRTGALLKVDGVTSGAFDREHHDVVLEPCDSPRELTLDVELHALPTNGLPAGPGVIWWYLNRSARQRPARKIDVAVAPPQRGGDGDRGPLMLIGHSHLDVAWLWTYEQTRRKAERTFAIACDLLERDPDFVFVQSQPQLYEFVEQADTQLFERVRSLVGAGRFDPDVAALWVESDCNVPSGESLLRQMLFAHAYCTRVLGTEPRIAWLPDTFGFCNTLPQLLAHAGIPYFMTTKLQWNDTTKFPYPQFVWEGPDGSEVVAALVQSYDGPAYPWRVSRAKERHEPLVLGYGDGGGGVTAAMLAKAPHLGRWIRPREWFDALGAERASLPRHRDELYLEYHRGVYTTHHDVKFHNALLERALTEAEELLAWCVAVHAPRDAVRGLDARLRDAWKIVLRNQFHDVLPGTSIHGVYDDVLDEYASAEEVVAAVIASAQTILPRAYNPPGRSRIAPQSDGGEFIFDNGLLRAQLRETGAITELLAAGGRNICSQANVLAVYEDKPKQWEAWNVDRGYARRMRHAVPGASRIADDALEIDFSCAGSAAVMRVSLTRGEPFLRVDLNVDWRARRRLLRVENWLPVQTDRVRYGSAHGTVERSARPSTPAEAAKFEVPGQRFAAASDASGNGLALFALDTYGWSARALPKGGLHLGHSLLRGTTWPDQYADEGEHRISYAFAPFAGATTGALEQAWEQFAYESRVRLFTCDDEAVLVTACKPAEDADGVIVRLRECNGEARRVALRCAARATQAIAVDALERPLGEEIPIEAESLTFALAPHQLRSFRVRFSHA